MPARATPSEFRGSCHCGQLRLVFCTALDPAHIVPRACDCTFCQKHGAAYVSDPAGHLSITLANAEALRRCRQGSNTAQFLLCDRCGVLVAVVFEQDGRVYGAVNARCLEEPDRFATAVTASPQRLAPDEKTARWSQLWIADVELTSTAAGVAQPSSAEAGQRQPLERNQ